MWPKIGNQLNPVISCKPGENKLLFRFFEVRRLKFKELFSVYFL